MAFFNAASAAGNIVGPLLFQAKDKPYYTPGVRAVLIIFIALVGLVGIQVVLLFLFNKQRENQREAAGKPRKIHDTSMDSKYQAYGKDESEAGVGAEGESFRPSCISYWTYADKISALNDITDVKNNEFVYVY